MPVCCRASNGKAVALYTFHECGAEVEQAVIVRFCTVQGFRHPLLRGLLNLALPKGIGCVFGLLKIYVRLSFRIIFLSAKNQMWNMRHCDILTDINLK